ncbi:MAG: CDP-alcohol phosphatidyltransferase family protein [Propionicimonas sp.]|uniref:CDP-alcohol phosphatidyltransferase family protein n=1 Tax=Propionicimonas sp. TaxID=1955623 RepID=UPI002B20F532|nr:CDP-alcohol phosphatidyltransferase family protein [Propionicimonas sp.]MEA4944770.1 CDP-alcohol phosphatidyltransferase family protein [Propionicimonas sp.]MEA5053118.1 CDP-alcohol phosphatidyltransferase family protein [Propionicimonas sp.]MEA5116455.1 CDP-alcohol phosphatidyltransferase family protein [Propionicimonas sp.]
MNDTTGQGYRAALERLRSAQKPSAGTPLYSRLVNRPLGRRFAALTYTWGWTPNRVTAVSAVFTFSGIALAALVPTAWWLGLVISALLVLGYALDSADGQLARLRGGGSVQGEWLDHTVDAAKVLTIHSAILIAAYRFFDLPPVWLLVPVVYLVVDSLLYFAMMERDLLLARAAGGKAPASEASTSILRAILILPSDYGLFCLVFVLFGFPPVFFVVYTLMLVSNTAFLLMALVKWYRQLGTPVQ